MDIQGLTGIIEHTLDTVHRESRTLTEVYVTHLVRFIHHVLSRVDQLAVTGQDAVKMQLDSVLHAEGTPAGDPSRAGGNVGGSTSAVYAQSTPAQRRNATLFNLLTTFETHLLHLLTHHSASRDMLRFIFPVTVLTC